MAFMLKVKPIIKHRQSFKYRLCEKNIFLTDLKSYVPICKILFVFITLAAKFTMSASQNG